MDVIYFQKMGMAYGIVGKNGSNVVFSPAVSHVADEAHVFLQNKSNFQAFL